MKLRDLTKTIRDYERDLAYGSETALWGEFWTEYRDKVEDDADLDTTDIDITDDEAEIWEAAYAKMVGYEKSGVDYNLDDLF